MKESCKAGQGEGRTSRKKGQNGFEQVCRIGQGWGGMQGCFEKEKEREGEGPNGAHKHTDTNCNA